MSKTNYLLLCLVVVLMTTLINLSQGHGSSSRGWSSGSSWGSGSGGWGSGSSHK